MDFTAKRKLAIFIPAVGLAWLGCSIGPQAMEVFPGMAEEFARQPLVFDPVLATEAGYHVHRASSEAAETATEINLDEQLGDYSSAGIQQRVAFYREFDARLHDAEDFGARDNLMDRGMWADYGVIEDRIARELFELETRRQYETDPNFYLEILGRALFDPLITEYAGADQRLGHIVARLEKVPEFLSQAQGNLQSSSELQIEAAKSQIADLVALIEREIPNQLPASGSYEGASATAVEALQSFSTYLDSLAASGEWRMSSALFEEKLKVDSALDSISVDELLTQLQTEYDAVYKDLIEAARPIHRSIYGNQRPPSEYALMRDILDIVSDENRLRSEDGFVDSVVSNLGEVRAFNTSQELLPVPTDVELAVSETPAFLRGRFPVSAFQAPPALTPSLGAEFWMTRLPEDASRGAVLAKLREYNNFKLKIVAVDAFARYVQAALSRTGLADENRRLIRNVNSNRAYTRGWAIYLIESTMDLGFNSGDNQFKLNWLKYKLEFLASAMLDIRLHTQGMPVDDAQTLLQRQVFMETGAIASALRSIQLNPTDNAIAYIGAQQWRRVRSTYQEATTDFSYSSFHGKALRAGPLPPYELVYITTEGQGRLTD